MKKNIRLLHNIFPIAFFSLFLGGCLQDKTTKQETKESPAISQAEEISEKLSEGHSSKIRLVKLKEGNKLHVEFYAVGFLGYKKSEVAFQICEVLALKKLNLDMNQYEIVAVGKNLVDKYGNESEEALITTAFSQETVNKINFQNIRMRDILDLADDVSTRFEMDE